MGKSQNRVTLGQGCILSPMIKIFIKLVEGIGFFIDCLFICTLDEIYRTVLDGIPPKSIFNVVHSMEAVHCRGRVRG